jgi:hypothetical protein
MAGSTEAEHQPLHATKKNPEVAREAAASLQKQHRQNLDHDHAPPHSPALARQALSFSHTARLKQTHSGPAMIHTK